MKKSPFIDDGYTIEAWLDETEQSPRIDFSYRRPLDSTIRQHLYEIDHYRTTGQGSLAVDASLKFVAKQIVRWDLPLPATPETMRKLNAETFGRFYAIMLGGQQPDGIKNGELPSEGDLLKNSTPG